MTEGAVLGFVASLIGLGAGIGIAKGLNALLAAAGLDLPQTSMVIATRTVVWSLAVGTLSRSPSRASTSRHVRLDPGADRDLPVGSRQQFPSAGRRDHACKARRLPAAGTAALTAALVDHADARVLDKAAWVKDRASSIDKLLNLLYVLLGLSVAIALLGMVNTLALSVMERTREFGTLRALGASRRQLRRMVRHESIVVALIGAAVGLPWKSAWPHSSPGR